MRKLNLSKAVLRVVSLGALLGALSACAVGPRLQAPQLQVVGVELLNSDLLQQQLRVRMHVHNPNDRALAVRGISWTLELEGAQFAHGDSERNFTVPALGDSEFDVNVTANAAAALLRFALRPGGRGGSVDYRLVGKVSLASGLLRSIPFDEHGTIKLR